MFKFNQIYPPLKRMKKFSSIVENEGEIINTDWFIRLLTDIRFHNFMFRRANAYIVELELYIAGDKHVCTHHLFKGEYDKLIRLIKKALPPSIKINKNRVVL